jgi:uncharacterized protein YjbI with pentapeptide repeats
MSGADLADAILLRADLRGADLTNTSLAGADLSQAQYDQWTVWPIGFKPD